MSSRLPPAYTRYTQGVPSFGVAATHAVVIGGEKRLGAKTIKQYRGRRFAGTLAAFKGRRPMPRV